MGAAAATILVMDDDDARFVFRRLLDQEGYVVSADAADACHRQSLAVR